MIVRREIAEPRRETGTRNARDWLRRLRRCLSRCAQTGTGANMKGASPQPYGKGPRGEPTGRGPVVAADRRLQQKCLCIMRARKLPVVLVLSSDDEHGTARVLHHPRRNAPEEK